MSSSQQEIISGIRSILTTRKGAATINQIRTDYENLMGQLKISDSALEQLMKNWRSDFMMFEKDGVKYFNSRCKESSEHIARFVAVQKSTAKKKPGRVQIQIPKRFHNNLRPPTHNPTAYSKIYRPDQQRTYQPSMRQIRPYKPPIYNNNNNNNTKTQNLNNYYPKKPEAERKQPEPIKYQQPQPKPVEKVPQESQPIARPLITSQPNFGAVPKASLQGRLKVEEVPKLQINSLTNRLTKNREINPEDLIAARSVPNTPNSSAATSPMSPVNWDVDSLDDFRKLEYYCKLNNFKPPVYTCIKTKFTDDLDMRKKNQYNALVAINNKTFSLYPQCTHSEETARLAVAAIAVKQLRDEEQVHKFPIDLDFDIDIARKIHALLRDKPSGVFKKSIPSFYRDTYLLSLPEHWFQIMCDLNGKLFDLNENLITEIIYALPEDTSDSNSVNSEPEDTIPELELPWNEDNWNLYVLNPVKTDQIFVRLIGPEWSEKMDSLLNDIEMNFVQEKPSVAGEIKIDRIYLCSVSDCWHRAKVVAINEKDKETNCFLIDQGDYETLKFNELFICPLEFMKLPPQAFTISLFGLEDFIDNPNSNVHLEDSLRWKSLIGKIVTSKQEFETMNRIDVKLFDTSGEDDVDLNEAILDKILSSNPLPSLSPKGINNIKVTHVDDFIYCQLVESFNYLNGLIMNLTKSNWNKKEHQGLYPENYSNLKRFYLIYDTKRNTWFRAQIVAAKPDKKTFTMNFVDAGIVEDVDLSNIYRIDKISIALTLYPAQVIKFKLFRVEMTENLKSRLRAWLPLNKDAMAKVASISNGVPYVYLSTYLRVNDQPIILKVNEQFNIDEGLAELKNNGSSNGSEIYDLKSLSKSLTKLEQCKLKHNGEFIKVHMTLVSSPQCFVIQLYDNLALLNEMMEDLQIYGQSRKNEKLPLEMIIKGDTYAAFNEDDNRWYRASIENVSYNIIHIYLVDYGSFKTLSNDRLRMLPEQFRKLPKQAMKAKLHGVRPIFGDYSPDDAFYFIQKTKNKTYPGVVKSVSTDHFSTEPVYELVLFDNDHKINDVLISENRALAV